MRLQQRRGSVELRLTNCFYSDFNRRIQNSERDVSLLETSRWERFPPGLKLVVAVSPVPLECCVAECCEPKRADGHTAVRTDGRTWRRTRRRADRLACGIFLKRCVCIFEVYPDCLSWCFYDDESILKLTAMMKRAHFTASGNRGKCSKWCLMGDVGNTDLLTDTGDVGIYETWWIVVYVARNSGKCSMRQAGERRLKSETLKEKKSEIHKLCVWSSNRHYDLFCVISKDRTLFRLSVHIRGRGGTRSTLLPSWHVRKLETVAFSHLMLHLMSLWRHHGSCWHVASCGLRLTIVFIID